MVLLKPALAELLLPHILADLARADDRGLVAPLSRLVAKHIFGANSGATSSSGPGSGLPPGGDAPVKAVRLLRLHDSGC